MTAPVHTCADCRREYTTAEHGGDSKRCGRCYTRNRRGGLKRQPDPDRGNRTFPMQFWFTPEQYAQISAAHPGKDERAAWGRRVLLEDLAFTQAAKKARVR